MISWRDQMLVAGLEYIERPAELLRVLESLSASNTEDDRYSAGQINLSVNWARHGLQSIVLPHKYAAALMATDPPKEAMFTPWPCFEIQVPNGLINVLGREPKSVFWSEKDTYCSMAVVWPRTMSSISFASRREFLDVCSVEAFEEIGHGQAMARAQALLFRLLVNTCAELANVPAQKLNRSNSVNRKDRLGRAHPNTITIGRPIDLDCRRDIRDYIAGSRSTEPKVTTLVRGHWRNQVHGPGNTLRKLVWIQPFHRGHGPLIVRHARLGFRHDALPVGDSVGTEPRNARARKAETPLLTGFLGRGSWIRTSDL